MTPRIHADRHVASIVCAGLCLVLVGCGNDVDPGWLIPVEADVRRPSEVTFVPIGESTAGTPGEILASLSALRPVAQLGGPVGTADGAFTKVEDVSVDANGRLFVLDSELKRVLRYSPDGTFQTAFEVSAQVRAPLSVLADETGAVYVGDLYRRIVKYVPDRSGYALSEVMSVDVPVSDMCRLKDRLVVHGFDQKENTVIGIYALGGTRESSFGTFYSNRNPMIAHQITSSRIACVAPLDMIVIATTSVLGEVRGYRSDGSLVWCDVFEGFRSIDVREFANGGMTVAIPADGHDRVDSVLQIDDDKVVVQVRRHGRDGSGREWARPSRTVVLDAHTGDILERASSIPSLAALLPRMSRVVSVGVADEPLLSIAAIVARS